MMKGGITTTLFNAGIAPVLAIIAVLFRLAMPLFGIMGALFALTCAVIAVVWSFYKPPGDRKLKAFSHAVAFLSILPAGLAFTVSLVEQMKGPDPPSWNGILGWVTIGVAVILALVSFLKMRQVR